jgi:hypothetical protein
MREDREGGLRGCRLLLNEAVERELQDGCYARWRQIIHPEIDARK